MVAFMRWEYASPILRRDLYAIVLKVERIYRDGCRVKLDVLLCGCLL